MLTPIVKALNEYNKKGRTVIKEYEGIDPTEIAEYVLLILQGLKCSFDIVYTDDKVTITDDMRG